MRSFRLVSHDCLDQAVEALFEDQQIFKHLHSIFISPISPMAGIIQNGLHSNHVRLISEPRAAEGVWQLVIHAAIIWMT
jgi:hypothetical protein